MRRLVALVVVALAVSSCKPSLPPVLRPDPPVTLPGLATMPTRTKAVHIFVLSESMAKDPKAIETFAAERGGTMNDVFIVGSEAMSYSYSEKRLLPILEAAKRNWEAIPFVDVREREQIQWQSETPFELTRIEKFTDPIDSQRPGWKKNSFKDVPVGNGGERGQTEIPKEMPTTRFPWRFDQSKEAPSNPFPRLARLSKEAVPAEPATGTAQVSIRSGIANMQDANHNFGQIYKLALTITVDGKRRDITPGLFVFACPSVPLRIQERTCHRRHVAPSAYPNRTKVIRLVNVDPKIAADQNALNAFVISNSVSESDVLIVNGEPMSYIHTNGLTNHDDALIDDHPVPYVMVQELEQFQWESNVDFFVFHIGKKTSYSTNVRRYKPSDPFEDFDYNPRAPKNPFLGFTMPQDLRRQFFSGVATLPFVTKPDGHVLGQLYKFSFQMMIDGKLVFIDPDGYTDM